MSGVLELPARRFTEVTGVLLAIATGLLGFGLERLARGATSWGVASLAAGGLATLVAFSLRVEDDPGRKTLLLVTREECMHCEEARAILQDAQAEHGFSFWEVDVEEDEQLRDRFQQEVPVLVAAGSAVARLEIGPEDVQRALGRA